MLGDHSDRGPDPEPPVTVVLDVANVMGSRPDGWWRDRAGAAERLLAGAVAVLAAGPPGAVPVRRVVVSGVVAVLEGRARSASVPPHRGLEVVLAAADGDAAVVSAARLLVAPASGAGPHAAGPHGAGPGRLVVVTADRGLREQLPAGAEAVGPRWWYDLVAEVDPE